MLSGWALSQTAEKRLAVRGHGLAGTKSRCKADSLRPTATTAKRQGQVRRLMSSFAMAGQVRRGEVLGAQIPTGSVKAARKSRKGLLGYCGMKLFVNDILQ